MGDVRHLAAWRCWSPLEDLQLDQLRVKKIVFCHMFPKGGFTAVEDECEHHFDWLMRLMGLWHGR